MPDHCLYWYGNTVDGNIETVTSASGWTVLNGGIDSRVVYNTNSIIINAPNIQGYFGGIGTPAPVDTTIYKKAYAILKKTASVSSYSAPVSIYAYTGKRIQSTSQTNASTNIHRIQTNLTTESANTYISLTGPNTSSNKINAEIFAVYLAES